MAETVLALTPGASESLALSLGLLTAVVALTGAAGQIERGPTGSMGLTRIARRCRSTCGPLVLTTLAGVPALVSFLLLVAGGAIGISM